MLVSSYIVEFSSAFRTSCYDGNVGVLSEKLGTG